ncbi:hypothetical protein GQR58_011990 [Nymphon striatum]|nr:hypothetical protein GQR58_011990 [Nymphon striatum]
MDILQSLNKEELSANSKYNQANFRSRKVRPSNQFGRKKEFYKKERKQRHYMRHVIGFSNTLHLKSLFCSALSKKSSVDFKPKQFGRENILSLGCDFNIGLVKRRFTPDVRKRTHFKGKGSNGEKGGIAIHKPCDVSQILRFDRAFPEVGRSLRKLHECATVNRLVGRIRAKDRLRACASTRKKRIPGEICFQRPKAGVPEDKRNRSIKILNMVRKMYWVSWPSCRQNCFEPTGRGTFMEFSKEAVKSGEENFSQLYCKLLRFMLSLIYEDLGLGASTDSLASNENSTAVSGNRLKNDISNFSVFFITSDQDSPFNLGWAICTPPYVAEKKWDIGLGDEIEVKDDEMTCWTLKIIMENSPEIDSSSRRSFKDMNRKVA